MKRLISLLLIIVMAFGIAGSAFGSENPFEFKDASDVFLSIWYVTISGLMIGGLISIPFQIVAAERREEQEWRDRKRDAYRSFGEFSLAPNFVGVNLHL
jgi:hypothetical protein